MINVQEAAVRLSTRPAVIQKLIDNRILRADYQNNIRESDLESLRRNSALLSKVSQIRRAVLEDEKRANDEQAKTEGRKVALAEKMETATMEGDLTTAKLCFEALSNLNTPVEAE